jgi:hypothetical protein
VKRGADLFWRSGRAAGRTTAEPEFEPAAPEGGRVCWRLTGFEEGSLEVCGGSTDTYANPDLERVQRLERERNQPSIGTKPLWRPSDVAPGTK